MTTPSHDSDSKPIRPIFYDPKQKRQKLVKRRVLLGLTIVLVLVANMVASMLVLPHLESLSLPIANQVRHLRAFKDSFKRHYAGRSHEATYTGHALAPVQDNDIDMYGFYVEWDDASYTSLTQNINKLDAILPEWMNLGSSGQVTFLNPDRMAQTSAFIKKTRPTLPIYALINNYNYSKNSRDPTVIQSLESDPIAREKFILTLSQDLEQYGRDGVTIDFENLTQAQWTGIVPVLQELTLALAPDHAKVLMTVSIDDNDIPYTALASVVDKLIVMGYDEHWSNANPGPIAGLGRYQDGITHILTQVPDKSKLVMAVGNYGYDWSTGVQQSQTLTRQEAMTTMRESSATLLYDSDSLNPYFLYDDESGTAHMVRFLDGTTFYNDLQVARNNDINTVALRRMWGEDPSDRKILNQHVLDSDTLPKPLETVYGGYDLDYEGTGGLLRLGAAEKTGSRTLTYDTTGGIITDEQIKSFATPYTIDRFGGRTGKNILLTFDDGPSTYTPILLNTLAQYHAKAAFFMIGANMQMYPDIVQDVYQQGNTIGNHTYSHPDISSISPDQFLRELNSTQRLIQAFTQHGTVLFRPPYSVDIEPSTIAEAQPLVTIDQLGYYIVGLDVDSNDRKNPGVANIVQAVVNGVQKGGSIILLHDGGGDRSQTMAALPQILAKLEGEGYSFVSAPTFFGVSQDTMMPPLQSHDLDRSYINKVSFSSLSDFLRWIKYIFVIGLILGLARLILVIVLAIYHARRSATPQATYRPLVTVLVPAYNEWVVIIKTLENLLRSDYPDLEIIMIDDGSTDDTFSIAQQHFGNNPKITLLTKPNGGKADALNLGISKAQGEIVVVQDADTLFRPDAIGLLVEHFADPHIGAVAGNVRVWNPKTLIAKFQSLEYLTSQNLDRRAFDILGAITVVPGAIGAWRKSAIYNSHLKGLKTDTLAEDSDLTVSVLRDGRKIVCEPKAIAYTEAPETMQAFLKQRFRRMFGILQVLRKHADMIGSFRVWWLGWFALPNQLLFQLLFPLIAPLLDLIGFINICVVVFGLFAHFSQQIYQSAMTLVVMYGIFMAVDALMTIIAFSLEKDLRWSLGFWFPLQRLAYRLLMYYVGLRVIYTALTGRFAGRNKLTRTGSVKEIK